MLFAASSLFAQDQTMNRTPPKSCCDQGYEMSRCKPTAGYSMAAGIQPNRGWDLNASASYILWQAREEGLDLAMISDVNTSPWAGNGFTPFPSTSSIVHPHFTFRSGFQVELGMNTDYDNWDVFADYTYFHSTITTGILPYAAPFILGEGNVIFPIQGNPNAISQNYFYSANQTWNLKMDFVDGCIGRSFYSGANLIVHPYFGVRTAWIRQKMVNEYNGSSLDISPSPGSASGSNTTIIHNKTISQGLGPRAGFDGNWLIGQGFRMIGDLSADILYTRYNYLFKQITTDVSTGDVSNNSVLKESHNDFLKVHADFEIGFGWGSYFSNHRWHMDISATYGYQVFWGQNMFRYFVNENVYGRNIVPNGDLSIHGLTATAKFDF